MLSRLTVVQSFLQVTIDPEGSATRRCLRVTIEKGCMAAYINKFFSGPRVCDHDEGRLLPGQ